MNKSLLIIIFTILLPVTFANAQSGTGGLKGFIKCGGIRNATCVVEKAQITLRPIENWRKTNEDINVEADARGYFDTRVSFGEYLLIISADGYETYQTSVYIPSSVHLNWSVRLYKKGDAEKFDGTWIFQQNSNGRHSSLLVTLREKDNKLEGKYNNVSSKESNGKILSSKIKGNTATLEVDCDWGGKGIVKITHLSRNRLRWQVIKRDERKGQFIVLLNEILEKT